MNAARKIAERTSDAAERLDALNLAPVVEALHARGFAVASDAMTATECADVRALYEQAGLFRSRIVMARHGFGQGEYQYFAYPLPAPVAPLRRVLYSRLAMVIFAVNNRPQKSAKGCLRVAMRHGVSTIRRGARMTLGVILHDAA